MVTAEGAEHVQRPIRWSRIGGQLGPVPAARRPLLGRRTSDTLLGLCTWLLLTSGIALLSARTVWPWLLGYGATVTSRAGSRSVRPPAPPPALPAPATSSTTGSAGSAGEAVSQPGLEVPGAPGVALAAAASAVAPAPPAWWNDEALQARLLDAVPQGIGRVGVAVRHLRTGASVLLNADAVMPPASLFKLGVLVEAFRQWDAGDLALDERLLLTWEDWADGSGVLQGRIGGYVDVEEALSLMIGVSDNTAALVLLRRLGLDAVNDGFERMGLAHTHFFPDWRPDTTTAAEAASLLAQLATGQTASPAATERMLAMLAQPQPQAWIQDALPPDTEIAHKSGQLPGVRNDAAIVFGPQGPYVVVVLTDTLADDADGEALIGSIARETEAYFATAQPGTAPAAALVP